MKLYEHHDGLLTNHLVRMRQQQVHGFTNCLYHILVRNPSEAVQRAKDFQMVLALQVSLNRSYHQNQQF